MLAKFACANLAVKFSDVKLLILHKINNTRYFVFNLIYFSIMFLHNLTNLIQLSLFLLKISALGNIHSFILCLFLSIQLLEAFPSNAHFIAFSLYYFFNCKLFLISFLQFFPVKSLKNFFAFKITNNICPRHTFFLTF